MNPALHFIPDGLFFLSGFIFILGMTSGLIIFPIIFNFKIIPEIEKRIGQKLDYHSLAKNLPFWKFLWPSGEISHYIFFKYLAQKTKISFQWFIPKDYALERVKYDINRSSKFEIVMSIIVMASTYITAIFVVIGLIIAHIYSFH